MASTQHIITAVLFGDTYNQISRKLKCSRRDISVSDKLINTHQLTVTTLVRSGTGCPSNPQPLKQHRTRPTSAQTTPRR